MALTDEDKKKILFNSNNISVILFLRLTFAIATFHISSLLVAENKIFAIDVKSVADPPEIDGALSDMCWKELKIIKDFRQRRPNEGEPATEKTEVRICRNDKTLFIGVRCFDSQPEKIRAGVMQRDATVK